MPRRTAALIPSVFLAGLLSLAAQGVKPPAQTAPPKTAVPAAAPASRDSTAPPAFGQVPTPQFGEVPAPQFGEVPAPNGGKPAAPAATPATQPLLPAAVPAPQAGLTWGEQAVLKAGLHYHPSGWSGSYYAMVQGHLDKWDFYTDGTCLHRGVVHAVGFAGGSSQRCVYTLNRDGTITLQFAPSVSASVSGRFSGASSAQAAPSQTVPIKMIGPQGASGLVLGKEVLHWRSW
ncbi:MAG: hypothetical protein EPN33_00910 [Acidobacteria bacterium]|nr:MAG: hypothetical protein EPN33_00910 [Acidobacteriota bacterium]